MSKKLSGMLILCMSATCLTGCYWLRATGPCYGVGCPAGAPGGSGQIKVGQAPKAQNAPAKALAQTASAQAKTPAQLAPAQLATAQAKTVQPSEPAQTPTTEAAPVLSPSAQASSRAQITATASAPAATFFTWIWRAGPSPASPAWLQSAPCRRRIRDVWRQLQSCLSTLWLWLL